jgi:hypothetical protein
VNAKPVTTRSGLAVSPEREAWAREQIALLGLVDGGPNHDDALDAARRGFPAWRIAQSFGWIWDALALAIEAEGQNGQP